MALPVSLDSVAEELNALMDETTAFIKRTTGEIASVSADDAALVEDEAEENDLPKWQKEALPKLREILLGNDWVRLPSKVDIHEWKIMRKFADSVQNEPLRDRLGRALGGKGAFRMFRATVDDAGLLDAWYLFRHAQLREIAKEALDSLGIPYS